MSEKQLPNRNPKLLESQVRRTEASIKILEALEPLTLSESIAVLGKILSQIGHDCVVFECEEEEEAI